MELRRGKYRAERIQMLKMLPWFRRLIYRILLVGYWPSLSLFARLAASFLDHLLIPGVAGDGTEEACQPLGLPQSRFTRYGSMIDTAQHIVLDVESRATKRQEKGIAADAIVITMACRLAPEKGIEVALESIDRALAKLSPDQRARVHLIIAGDGVLRKQIEADIHARELQQTCVLWGEISAKGIPELLSLSDIFWYLF